MNPIVDSMQQTLAAQRQAFLSHPYPSLAERKQKLLYAVPWPASGIWSAVPLSNAAALKSLKIRTYDEMSTDVLGKVTASATLVSFNDLDPKLQSGDINAVLSSCITLPFNE